MKYAGARARPRLQALERRQWPPVVASPSHIISNSIIMQVTSETLCNLLMLRYYHWLLRYRTARDTGSGDAGLKNISAFK